jgi:transposase, IS30 family
VRWNKTEEFLYQDWSPEQVSGWLCQEEGITFSHKWIYLYIYADKRDGGDLHFIHTCVAKSSVGSATVAMSAEDILKTGPALTNGLQWLNGVPLSVTEKPIPSSNSGGALLVTLVERKSRQSIFVLSPDKPAKAVRKAIIEALQPNAANVYTITYDNCKESAFHEEIASALNAKGYCAHPYHSWERRLNENMNGLIRQYLPKGKSIDSLTEKDIQHIMVKLNNLSRKYHCYKTLNQAFWG